VVKASRNTPQTAHFEMMRHGGERNRMEIVGWDELSRLLYLCGAVEVNPGLVARGFRVR
jgi:hypothetical protein